MPESTLEELRGELRTVSDDIGRLQKARFKRQAFGAFLVKLVLVVGASALVAAAQFMALQPGEELGTWGVVGIGSAGLIFLGGLYTIVTDKDAASELERARKAVALARSYDDVARQFDFLVKQMDRATELYHAMALMRTALQAALEYGVSGEVERIRALFQASDPTLLLAFDFEFGERWTLSVYRADESDPTAVLLRCVETRRFERQVDGNTIRAWPVGVGFAGIAYARGRELIIPDLSDPALGTLDDLPEPLRKVEDQVRYRSVAAVPVVANGRNWGIAVATSDKPRRFHSEEESGVRSTEAVRALAGMVALAVASPSSAPMASSPAAPITIS